MEVDSATVVHAYGVVVGGTSLPLPDTGIGGSGVALLDAGPVAAVFSRLPGTDYGSAAWREHAEDPSWLADVALEHQKVLGELIESTDVLPMRLPAMYRDEMQLHELLTHEASLFRAALDSVHDHVEWSVQLFLASEPEPVAEKPMSGREYILQKSDAARQRQDGRERRQRVVREAYASLVDVSRQSAANPPHDPALTGRSEVMLLNSAHLVSRRHERLFFDVIDETVERVSPHGITVEVRGPWPPYNFVELGVDPRETPT
jgi:hypothetical protein